MMSYYVSELLFLFLKCLPELGWMSLDLRVAQSLCKVLGPIFSTENKHQS